MKKRFLKKYTQVNKFDPFNVHKYIFVDKETGVNYLYMGTDNGGGITPLLDKAGKPVITREDII